MTAPHAIARPVYVPHVEAMVEMTDEALEALAAELHGAMSECIDEVARLRADGRPTGPVDHARRSFTRGLRNVAAVRAQRAGVTLEQFAPAKPIVTFEGAYDAHRAINRLLGLCQVEHDVLGAFLASGPVLSAGDRALLTALEDAYRSIEAALAVGLTATGCTTCAARLAEPVV